MIYLDYHATSPCDPRVLEAMLPYFVEAFGNPSSGLHKAGRQAAAAIDESREAVASLLGAEPSEVIFTSGATESCNLAILGLARAAGDSRRRIVTTPIEHKAVLLTLEWLKEDGFELTVLPVGPTGRVDLAVASGLIDDRTLLLSVQAANNEIGTIQPLKELAEIAHDRGAVFHTDAAQAVGKVPIDLRDMGIDLVAFSGHKMCGPKGIGALLVRRQTPELRLAPLMAGGGQEHGLRPGTPNVPGIVGLGMAARICAQEMEQEWSRVSALRDEFECQMTDLVPTATINSDRTNRLPGSTSLTFSGIPADALILNAPDLALSTGSACNSGALEPSRVLTAIGLSREDADSTLRVCFGRFSAANEPALAAEALFAAYGRLRSLGLS